MRIRIKKKKQRRQLYNLLSKRKKRKKTTTTNYNLIAIYHDAPDHEKKKVW